MAAAGLARLEQWLTDIGATGDEVLSCFFPDDANLVNEIQELITFTGLELSGKEREDFVEGLMLKVAAAKQREALRRRATAGLPSWALASRAAKRAAREEWDEEEARFARRRVDAVRQTPPPPPARALHLASTRRQRAFDGDERGREKGEEAERARWMRELADLVRSSGVHLLDPNWDGLDGQRLLALVAGGRRASTLRTRARTWRAFMRFLRASTGSAHPRSAMDAVDYVQARAAEPCSKSVLLHLKSLFNFIDTITDSTPPLAEDRLVVAALQEALSQAPARRTGDACQAARFPLTLVAGLEAVVCDEGVDDYGRIIAWWTLATCWGTLRFDDHRGLPHDAFRAIDDGFIFELTRSKTTGADKGARQRSGIIVREAHLVRPEWFAIGLQICHRASPYHRDYWLCAPSPGGSGTIHREVVHDEFCGRLRGLLAKLVLNGVELGMDIASSFTPHSGRNFLPSAAAALGAGKDDIDRLGAWSVKGGSAYIRTIRSHTARLQGVVAQWARAARGDRDTLADQESLDALGRHLGRRGVSKERQSEILDALAWSGGGPPDRTVLPLARGAGAVAGAASSVSTPGTAAVGAALAESGAAAVAVEKMETIAEENADASSCQGYVCSLLGRRDVRRLHYIGLCHRRPGHDYARFRCFGDRLPEKSEYDAVCRQCWPSGDPREQIRDNCDSSVPTSDESSSTSGE